MSRSSHLVSPHRIPCPILPHTNAPRQFAEQSVWEPPSPRSPPSPPPYLDVCRELRRVQRPVQDGGEDALEGRVVKVDDGQHVEVAGVAAGDLEGEGEGEDGRVGGQDRRDGQGGQKGIGVIGGWSHLVSAAAGGAHGRHEEAVVHAAEGVLAVVPGGERMRGGRGRHNVHHTLPELRFPPPRAGPPCNTAPLYCPMYCPMYAPAAVVHELPEKLDWGLGAVRLKLRGGAEAGSGGAGGGRWGEVGGGHSSIQLSFIRPSMEEQVAIRQQAPSSPRCPSSSPSALTVGMLRSSTKMMAFLPVGGPNTPLRRRSSLASMRYCGKGRGGGDRRGQCRCVGRGQQVCGGSRCAKVGRRNQAYHHHHHHHPVLNSPQLSLSPASCWPSPAH